MKRWKTRTRVLLLLVSMAVAAMGYVLYTRYNADFPTAQAILIVQSGGVHITHAAGAATDVTSADKSVLISAGDTFETNGLATLSFTDVTAIDLFPGTRLRLDQFGKSGDDLQVSLSVLAGQLVSRIGSFADSRAYYRTILAPQVIAQTQSGQFVAAVSGERVLLGAMNGTTVVTASDTLTIPEGNGVIIEKGIANTPPQPWSPVRVPLYRPDGSSLVWPITFSSANSTDSFIMVSDRALLMPSGTYTLSVDLLQPYTLSNIVLVPGKLLELPVTLSELVFNVTDADGKPITSPALIASAPNNHQANVQPNMPVLLGPGSTSLNIARSDAPDLWQSTGKLDVLPGQRLPVLMRNDLFGSGSLQISVTGTDGTPQTARVSIYPEGSDEKATATNNYRVESLPPALPRGKYAVVVMVRNSIAARIPVTINTGEVTTLKVEMGTLAVSYTDSAGRAIAQLVYIASEGEMTRLALPIEQMRNTPYGYGLTTGQTIMVPAGRYVVKIGDARVPPQTVTVTGGQTAQITVTAP